MGRMGMTVSPDKVRALEAECAALRGQITYECMALSSMVCPPTAWGQLGSTAAAGTQKMMEQGDRTLLTLIKFLELSQSLIKLSADMYQKEDQNTAHEFKGICGGMAQ